MRNFKTILIGGAAVLAAVTPAAAQSVSDDVNVSLTLEVPNVMAFSVLGDVNITYSPEVPRDQYFETVDACIFTNAGRVRTTVQSANAPSGAQYQFVKDSGEGRIGYVTNLYGYYNGSSELILERLKNGDPREFNIDSELNGSLFMSDESCSDGVNLSFRMVFNPIVTDMAEGPQTYRIIEDYIEGEGATGTITLSDTLTVTVEPVLLDGASS